MIISASRRTDIPAFYSEWFMNRIRAGFCCCVNPFNSKQSYTVPLQPDQVDVIVFWTRNPSPLIKHLPELDSLGYRYYFQFTMNGYPKLLEPNLPSLQDSIDIFRRLSDAVGPQKVIWRYDPILFSSLTSYQYHRDNFRRIATELSGYTEKATISIADQYRSIMPRIRKLDIGYEPAEPDTAEFGELMVQLAASAAEFGMGIFSCAEVIDLKPFGISPGRCIDNAYIKRVFGIDVNDRKDKTQRPGCGCVVSKDIGSYNTCIYGCSYCYANKDFERARANQTSHDQHSPSLSRPK